jgi:hypothetical protein
VNRDEYWKQVEEQQQELKENFVLYKSGAISPEELVRRNNEVADRLAQLTNGYHRSLQ